MALLADAAELLRTRALLGRPQRRGLAGGGRIALHIRDHAEYSGLLHVAGAVHQPGSVRDHHLPARTICHPMHRRQASPGPCLAIGSWQ